MGEASPLRLIRPSRPDQDRLLFARPSLPGGGCAAAEEEEEEDGLFRSFEFPDSFPIPCSFASPEIQSYD